jgi:putative transposase
VAEHKESFGVEPICRELQIAPSTYYAAAARPPSARSLSDAQLWEQIQAVHAQNHGVYGARKVWLALRRQGVQVARCTVERLMRSHGLVGTRRGKAWRTTIPDLAAARPADLVNRTFAATAPNRLWVADFTYCSTWSGTAFTAFVIDVFSKRIVGWRTAATMGTDLPLDALEMALWSRKDAVTDVVHHSDRGSQYTSIRYTERLIDAGARCSVGTTGDSYDNALAESTIGLYKAELVKKKAPWKTVDELEIATLIWVDWYNHQRLHSSIGDIPPVEYEANYYAATGSEKTQSRYPRSLHQTRGDSVT